MKRIFLAAAAVLLVSTALAGAADLSVAPLYKAPASPFSSANGAGFYWGFGTSLGVDQANASASGIFATSLVTGNLNAAGGSVDGEMGWISSIQGTWVRLGIEGTYQNIGAGVSNGTIGTAFSSKWGATERFDVNANILQTAISVTGLGSNLTSYFTGFNPALPGNVKAGTPMQYIGFILHEEDLGTTVACNVSPSCDSSGRSILVAPGVETGWLFPLLGPSGQPNGMAADLFAQVDWPTRGLEVNNVFATAGGPSFQRGGITIGTEYRTGIHLLLP